MMIDEPVQIRLFRFAEDYENVYRLWAGAGDGIHLRRSDEPSEIAKKLERDPDLFLVAELNGNIVGAVLGGFDGRRGMMYHLAVVPAFRKRGVAAMLVNELESRLRAKGCIRYFLLVTRENQGAIDFYERHNFQRMDELLPYAKDLI